MKIHELIKKEILSKSTISDYAKAMKMGRTTLSEFVNGRQNLGYKKLFEICEDLNIKITFNPPKAKKEL